VTAIPPSRTCLAAGVSALLMLGACCNTNPCCDPPKTASPKPSCDCPDPPNIPRNAVPVPLARLETPEARNERLMRLEWAQDQWWAATQHQEYEKQASLESLLRTYVADHYEAIVSDLEHGSPRHRRTMAMALGFSGRQDAVPHLETALKDQYYEVVLHGLLALYQLSKGDTPAAKAAAKTDQNPNARPLTGPVYVDPEIVVPYLRHPKEQVRSNAALVLSKTLGRNPKKELLLVVVAAAEDVDPATRAHAVAALGTTNDREVFPYLVKALKDQVQLVRIRAALSLGRLNDPEAVPYLIGVLDDHGERDDVKRAASKSLGEIMGTTEIDTLDPSVWRNAAKKMHIEGSRN
jgi:HEAT repeat protein